MKDRSVPSTAASLVCNFVALTNSSLFIGPHHQFIAIEVGCRCMLIGRSSSS